jgi:2-oxoisovalerate dehydrogenase E1 component beta subunit
VDEASARRSAGEYYSIPLGKAAVARAGEDVTVLAYGTMVHVALSAAAETGVDAEVIDLRTLRPIDIDAIQASIEKTGRCVIVHEATRIGGFGAELSALVQEHCFYHLEAPIERVTGGIRRTRTRSNGSTFPDRRGSGARCAR